MKKVSKLAAKDAKSLASNKKPNDAIPVQKKESKQPANSWEDAKSLSPKRSLATQSPSKKVSKQAKISPKDTK